MLSAQLCAHPPVAPTLTSCTVPYSYTGSQHSDVITSTLWLFLKSSHDTLAVTVGIAPPLTLVRYLRNYYFEINSVGDLLVNEMIDVFEGHPAPHGAMFAIQHPDTDLVVVCARHITEDALVPQKLTAWLACQRPRGHGEN